MNEQGHILSNVIGKCRACGLSWSECTHALCACCPDCHHEDPNEKKTFVALEGEALSLLAEWSRQLCLVARLIGDKRYAGARAVMREIGKDGMPGTVDAVLSALVERHEDFVKSQD